MLETKQKSKVKRKQDDAENDGVKQKAIKTSKSPDFVKRNKEIDLKASKLAKVKKENVTSPVKAAPITVVKAVKVKTEFHSSDTSKIFKNDAVGVKKESVKKDADFGSKASGGRDIGKVKIVKKEEEVVTLGGKNIKVKAKEEPEKREKKVYSLPGQKHDPPEERDPLRIFYESLYEQNSESEMAEVWMMEHGLLPSDIAKKALERKQKRQRMVGTPVKSSKENIVKSEKKSSTVNGESKVHLKSKRKLEDSDDDDDFIIKPKKKLKMNA